MFHSSVRSTTAHCFKHSTPFQMALQSGVGLGLRYNMPPGLSVPCSISPFVYPHLSQVHGHVIQPSHSWSSSSSRCIQLSVQHLFWDCGVLHYTASNTKGNSKTKHTQNWKMAGKQARSNNETQGLIYNLH